MTTTPTPHVSIGLINPKSATNVGAVMRASGCYQVNSVRYTGERYERAAKYHTDTHNARLAIPLTGMKDILEDLPQGMQVVCVDLIEGATPLPHFEHPASALYVFGPEDGTISQELLDRADHAVYVPTVGCMNLAASVNVVLYDRLAKSDLSNATDELVKSSRDINNNVKVKLADEKNR
ncbi:RNA methyltransferase [Echinimonas agarilytica]|uniref:RNA methyltransferase n=1 Tax=Echinimonas agarilytica TaxID=1215918 RepID=A0AA41W7X3_9GAMM|nr:RNA methyltransferase [Echinimonas agarilytica]MCM2680278.1 RNA methyltransferase [Echinimonas agarilytica]